MEISQSALFWLIVYSAATGLVLGVIYSAVGLVRELIIPSGERYKEIELPLIKKRAYKSKSGRLVKALKQVALGFIDFIFMITCAIAVILVAYTENMGRMRWLIPFGAALGFFLYRATLGRLILKISVAATFFARAASVYLYSILTLPIMLLIGKIRRINFKEVKKKGGRLWHAKRKSASSE